MGVFSGRDGAGLSAGLGAVSALALALGLSPSPSWGQGGPTPPPTAVVATPVEVGIVIDHVTAIGTLISNESVIIRPEIPGRVTEILFREGHGVEQGAALVALDDSVLRADLADARARLQLGERNFERAKELFDRSAGTARARDEAESQLASARAAIEVARARLEKTRIHAPFSGIVGLRRVSVGDYVVAGQDLVNLEDIAALKADFSIPERYLAGLAEGQPVQIRADAFPGRVFAGHVLAIDPKLDPATRSVRVRATVPNDDLVLRPGLFVRVELELGRREGALIIPEEAIVPRGAELFVFRVVDGTARLTKVEIGQRRFGRVEVLAGLGAEDVVVSAGQLKIGDGSPVRAVDGPAR